MRVEKQRGLVPFKHPEIVAKLEVGFEKLRESLLRGAHQRNLGYSHLTSGLGPVDELIGGSVKDYPGPDYFQAKIVPVAQSLAGSPQEFESICLDGARCMQFLLAWAGRTRSFGTLINTFFDDIDLKEPSYGCCSAGPGQFKYFYDRYGRHGALAVAAFQGRECDLHYDGTDYSYSTSKMERMLEATLSKMPPEYHDRALEAFTNYGGGSQSKVFWKHIADVVKAFIEAGKENLLPQFFEIAASAPPINGQHEKSQGFPVVEPCEALEQLEGLDNLPVALQNPALRFAVAIIHSARSQCIDYHPVFAKTESDNWYGIAIDIPAIIEKLVASGKSEQQIEAIFQIPSQVPNNGHLIVEKYCEIEEGFPGGVNGLIRYLQTFTDAPRCAASLIDFFPDNKLPPEKLQIYLDVGASVASKIGDGGADYFSLRFNPQMQSLLDTDSEGFKRQMQDALEFSGNFVPPKIESGDAAKTVFSSQLSYCKDPQLPQLREGFMCMRDLFLERVKNDPETHVRDLLNRGLERYLQALVRTSEKKRSRRDRAALPSQTEIIDHARIAAHFMFLMSDLFGECHDEFLALVENGLDYRVAAQMRSADLAGRQSHSELRSIHGLSEGPIPSEKILKISKAIASTRALLIGILNVHDEHGVTHLLAQVGTIPNRDSVAVVKMDDMAVEKIDEQLIKLDAIREDPDIAGVFDDSSIRRELEQVKAIAFFRSVMNIGVTSGRFDVPESPFLANTNPTTRAVISGAALVAALGGFRVPGFEPKLVLPAHGVAGTSPQLGQINVDGNLTSMKDQIIEGTLAALPFIEQMVLADRNDLAGEMPVGLKVHTPTTMDPAALKALEIIFGLGQTPFHLIHAGESLLLPPMVSSLEAQLMMIILQTFGVIDKTNFDLQITNGGGHWSEDAASIVGSSMLLGSSRRVQYAPGAFSSTHSETGDRIMVYDAGVKVHGLPFDIPVHGRTDILGQHSLGDIPRFRLLATLASHAEHYAMLAPLMEQYTKEYKKILAHHGLLPHIMESAWIQAHAKPDDTADRHEAMVRRFTGAWKDASNEVGLGVIADVNTLMNETVDLLRGKRKEIITRSPGDYEKLMRY